MHIQKLTSVILLGMGIFHAEAATRYVSAANATPAAPYTSWATAATDLQAAIDVAGSGDTLVVSNGVYSKVGGLYVDEAIHIESLNGVSTTFLDGLGNFECISLADPNCSISGFTIQNGSNHRGGGVYSLYANAVVSNCVIRSCSASIGGGGVYQGTLYNCEISGNESADLGGGTYDAELNHCTVTGNEAQSGAGGVYDGTANNCIIWGNSSPGYWKDMASVTANYSCSPDLTHGSNGNITNAPILVSSSHIATNSPCRGAGSAVYSIGVDIDGESWISPPSMGCDENAGAGNIFGAIFLSVSGPTSVVTNIEVAYAAQIDGPLTAALLQIGNQPAVTNPAGPVLHVWPTDGAEQIILTAFSDSYPAGLSFTQSVQIVSLAASAVHVSDASGNDGNDGSTWALAKKTIQAGVDAQSIYRGLVLVSNGTYSAATRIDIAKDLFVQGMEGDLATIIDGPGGVSLNSSRTVLSGFTVQNAQYGGIHCFNTVPVITNCVIRDNANSYGGGVYRGTVVDCVVSNNNAYTPGLGGGLHESIIYNSLIISNTANAGGGVDKCTAYNSTIVGNTVNSEAGGALNSTLNNCLVVGNTAYRGGGTFFGTANNCTVVGNHATDSAGGMYRGIVNNTIVRDNISDINLGNNTYTPSAADLDYFRNTCSFDLTHGVNGNITNAPNFVNAAAGNYRLNNNSPCIDAGKNAYVVGVVDLDGGDRILYDVVDMGAYEWILIPSPIENLTVSQRPGTKLVDIYYDLTSSAAVELFITNGVTSIGASSFTGDVGPGQLAGISKHVVWDAGADWDGNVDALSYSVFASGESATVLVAKTGQTTSYQMGDDGDHQSGAEWPTPRFTTTVNGTAIDHLTGLEWVLDPSALGGNNGPVNWANALAYCSSLAYAGGEWRLPSYKEMASLIDFGNNAPALPAAHPFLNIQTVYSYWTGSSSPWNTGDFALSVNFNYGQVSDGQKSSSGVIWPVRGYFTPEPAPSPVPVTGQVTSYSAGDDGDLQPGAAWPVPRFSDTGNGTVTDHLTGLEWVNAPHSLAGNAGLMSWSNAVEFCEGLDYASNQNWRLPSIKELESMVSLASNSPPSWLNGPETPLNGIFEGNYWSGTTLAGSSGSARYVNTYLFSVGYLSKPSPVRVWPVRSVQASSGGAQVASAVDTRDYLLSVSSTHSLQTIIPGSALDIRIDLGDQSPAPGGHWNTIGTASFSSGSAIALKDHTTGLTAHGVTLRDGSGSQNAPLTMSSAWNANTSKDWVEPSAVADQLLSLGAHFFAIEGLDPAKTYRMETLAASDLNNGEMQTHFIVDTLLGNPTRGNGWAPTSTMNGTASGTGSQVDTFNLYSDGWAAANWLIWDDVVPGRHGYEGQGYGADAVLFTLSTASVGYLNALRISELSAPTVITQDIAVAAGSLVPDLGTHAYAWNSTVTASVGTVVSIGGTNYTSTGWLGTGSVPVFGNTQNTGAIPLTELASSIDWRWMVDNDADLIPDHWELLYFGSETGAVATADIDDDGYTAAQEYILGSNPTSQGSSFLFTPGTNPPPGEFSVDFTTAPGRLYTVECTEELGSGNWQALTNFVGDGSAVQIIDPSNIPACFYQVRIDWVE